MKKSLFASLFVVSIPLLSAVGFQNRNNVKVVLADESSYEFIEQKNAIELMQKEFNANVSIKTFDYEIQSGDYLAIDIEGYNNYQVFKVGFNGSYISDGQDWKSLDTFSTNSEWGADFRYGLWTFVSDGRGIIYIPLEAYFPLISQISTFNLLLSDNKLEDIIVHDIFVTDSVTSRDGFALLDLFNEDGTIIEANIVKNDVIVSRKNSIRGFGSNKTLSGGIVLDEPKTHIEITVNSGISFKDGFIAYDMSFNGEWVYFKVAYQNHEGNIFNDDYFATGKPLSKHSSLSYDSLSTQYGFYWCSWNVTGTVLETITNFSGTLEKIIIDCDNLPNGAQLVLSNFYYISNDLTEVTPLIDFLTMEDEEFYENVSSSVNGSTIISKRAPEEMKIYYLAPSISENAVAETDGYSFDVVPVERQNHIVSFEIDGNELGLYETTIDYIAHVPWAIINIDGTEVHNGTMEENQVVISGEKAFSTYYTYDSIQTLLDFLDNGVLVDSFDEYDYETLVAIKQEYNSFSQNIKKLVDGCSLFDQSIFDLSNKVEVEMPTNHYEKTGSAIEPEISINLGEHRLQEYIDYVIEYSNNILPGTAKIDIRFTGNFTGSYSLDFYIDPLFFTINFDSGLEEGEKIDSLQVEEYTNYKLPENPFTAPIGKEFEGWKINGKGSTLKPGQIVTISSDITLIAQWKDVAISPKKGCGGSVVTDCTIMSIISLVGLFVLVSRLKKDNKKRVINKH